MPLFNSSAIERAEYDEPSSTLQIWFTGSGGPYSYYGVPPHIYQGLCAAASQGQYYAVYIRDKYSRDARFYRR